MEKSKRRIGIGALAVTTQHHRFAIYRLTAITCGLSMLVYLIEQFVGSSNLEQAVPGILTALVVALWATSLEIIPRDFYLLGISLNDENVQRYDRWRSAACLAIFQCFSFASAYLATATVLKNWRRADLSKFEDVAILVFLSQILLAFVAISVGYLIGTRRKRGL
jgi:hypothetical protein